MKRLLAIAAAILAPAFVLAAAILLVTSRGMPADVRSALQEYYSYRYGPGVEPSMVRANLATKPWLLTPGQSGPTFGEGVFDVTILELAAGPISWPSTPVSSADHYSKASDLRALPYPPAQVWCVLLKSGEAGEVPILVAAHSDLYNARWIVHEMPGTWSSDQVNTLLDELGCGFKAGN